MARAGVIFGSAVLAFSLLPSAQIDKVTTDAASLLYLKQKTS